MFWFVFFFKQKTAYERRICDWSSDVCSSDLRRRRADRRRGGERSPAARPQYRHGFPELLALRPYDGVREHGLLHAPASSRQGGDREQGPEESRGGKECVSTCRYRGFAVH